MPITVEGDNKYRFGFNGKENDNEGKGGDGLQQDYGMRIYDNRLGRFLRVDPLHKSYPWNSTYAFAENRVIHCVDLDGGEAKYYVINLNADNPVLTHYKTKDFGWLPNFLEPDVVSVEVLGLNTTYTFLDGSSGKNTLYSFEHVFKKGPVAAIYCGEYRTDADIMDEAIMDLAFGILVGRALMMKGVGSSKGMSDAKLA